MSIKGINNKPFVDVSTFIDLNSFSSLHPEICNGFVKAKNLCELGLLDVDKIDQEHINLSNYDDRLKPIYYLHDIFKSLPDDDPVKIAGSKFQGNDLILYLTYALGAHNPFKIYSLFNFTDDWMMDSSIRNYTEISQYFPSLINWINQLKVFSHIGKAYFLVLEGGGISIEHCDLNPRDGVINEFIHIRSDLTRPFYIKDMNTSEKFYINTKAVYFNDQDYHGGDATPNSTYALRIDGVFSDEFRKHIWG
jgi:hypothetical protein